MTLYDFRHEVLQECACAGPQVFSPVLILVLGSPNFESHALHGCTRAGSLGRSLLRGFLAPVNVLCARFHFIEVPPGSFWVAIFTKVGLVL